MPDPRVLYLCSLGTVQNTFCCFPTPWAHMSKPRTIRWVLLLAAIAAAGYFGWHRFQGTDHAAQVTAQKRGPGRGAVTVKIAPVEKADFPVYLTGLGTVQGFNTVVVRSRVDGQINRIAFKEGQFVKQGDTLVEIDPRPFQAALDQAKAKKAQDEANLANANLDLQRYTKLGEFATRQQTDTQRSTVAQLTAQITADTAAIENAQTQLDYTTIKAPISGVTGLRQVDVGNIVNAATQTGIVTIAQIEPIAVIFTAPEDQLPEIKAALAAAAAEDDRALHRRQARAVDRHAGADQQPGRHVERNHPAQGGVRQQGPCAVAGPVGFDPAAGRDAEGRHRGPRQCGSAWHGRSLRLRCQPGEQGRAPQDQGDAVDRRPLRGR